MKGCMMKYNKKVLLVLEEDYETDGEIYSSDFTWGYYALNFLKYFDKSYIFVPLKEVKKCTMKNTFTLPNNISIVGRPYYKSFKEYYKTLIQHHNKYKKLSEEYVKHVDVVIVRAPSQISNFIVAACKKYDKKLIVIFAGNFLQQANPLMKQNIGILKKIFLNSIAKIIEKGHVNLAKQSSLMILYGKELETVYSKYNKNYIFSNTPTIYNKYLYKRTDTCKEVTIKLIRVASYLPSKDYETLIEAVKILKQKNINLVLNTFGTIFDEDYYQDLLKLSDVEYINLNPPVEFGNKLFDKYKDADIQIITSKSEGIPRTILEGASFSIPLITTNVGGISTNITNEYNGLYIETENVDSLVSAILTIIGNDELRQKIIMNGFEMAQNMSIENMSVSIANEINKVDLSKEN